MATRHASRTVRLRRLRGDVIMRQNLRPYEQKVRMAIGGAAATALLIPLSKKWKSALAAVAALALVTGAVGYSPLKQLLGIR